MKVLQVINNLSGGGAEKLVTEISIELNRKQIKTDILIFNNNNDKYTDILNKNGIRIINLNQKNIYNPMIIFKVIKYLKNYDVIHVHLFPAFYWIALSSFFIRKNLKLIYTEHSTHNKRRDIKFLKFLEKYIYSKYNQIISITNEVQSNLINWIKPKDRLKYKVINNGINLDRYKKAKKYDKNELVESLPENSVIITMVSRFSEAKDQKTLIKAMKYLPDNYHLLLVGEGKLKKECENLSRDLNLENRVHFLGFRKDIPEIFKTSDVIVQSSHWEGFGLTAVEAMASGKPVIVSNVPGLVNVVGISETTFNVGDYEQLKNIILKLVKDNNYYTFVSKKAKNLAIKYDIKYMIDKIIKCYYE